MPLLHSTELNWRRGLGEVALIFVGITLALLFDNWNQDRKERILERQLLSEVRDDLVATRSDLETDIATSHKRLGLWRDLAKSLSDNAPLDETWTQNLTETLNFSVVFAKTSGYRSLTSQGLGILSDPTIRTAITDFYELRLARISAFEQLIFPFYGEVYLPFVRSVTQIPHRVLWQVLSSGEPLFTADRYALRDAEVLRNDPKLAHMFFQMSLDTELVLSVYQPALVEVSALIALIDAHLAGQG